MKNQQTKHKHKFHLSKWLNEERKRGRASERERNRRIVLRASGKPFGRSIKCRSIKCIYFCFNVKMQLWGISLRLRLKENPLSQQNRWGEMCNPSIIRLAMCVYCRFYHHISFTFIRFFVVPQFTSASQHRSGELLDMKVRCMHTHTHTHTHRTSKISSWDHVIFLLNGISFLVAGRDSWTDPFAFYVLHLILVGLLGNALEIYQTIIHIIKVGIYVNCDTLLRSHIRLVVCWLWAAFFSI